MAQNKSRMLSRLEIDFASGENTFGLRVFKEKWRRTDGTEKTYWKYGLPDVVMVAGFTVSCKIIAIEEFQPGVGATYLHLVGGSMDQDGESPAETAARELKEETGFHCKKIELLSTMAYDSGRSDRKIFFFLATCCEKVGEPEAGITVSLMHPLEFWERLMAYFTQNPTAMRGGANSLKTAVLALRRMSYLHYHQHKEGGGQ